MGITKSRAVAEPDKEDGHSDHVVLSCDPRFAARYRRQPIDVAATCGRLAPLPPDVVLHLFRFLVTLHASRCFLNPSLARSAQNVEDTFVVSSLSRGLHDLCSRTSTAAGSAWVGGAVAAVTAKQSRGAADAHWRSLFWRQDLWVFLLPEALRAQAPPQYPQTFSRTSRSPLDGPAAPPSRRRLMPQRLRPGLAPLASAPLQLPRYASGGTNANDTTDPATATTTTSTVVSRRGPRHGGVRLPSQDTEDSADAAAAALASSYPAPCCWKAAVLRRVLRPHEFSSRVHARTLVWRQRQALLQREQQRAVVEWEQRVLAPAQRRHETVTGSLAILLGLVSFAMGWFAASDSWLRYLDVFTPLWRLCWFVVHFVMGAIARRIMLWALALIGAECDHAVSCTGAAAPPLFFFGNSTHTAWEQANAADPGVACRDTMGTGSLWCLGAWGTEWCIWLAVWYVLLLHFLAVVGGVLYAVSFLLVERFGRPFGLADIDGRRKREEVAVKAPFAEPLAELQRQEAEFVQRCIRALEPPHQPQRGASSGATAVRKAERAPNPSRCYVM